MTAQSMQQASSQASPSTIIEYLNCKPECTLWRRDYCRITAYAFEPQMQSFLSGSVTLGQKHTANVNRAADLMENICLYITITKLVATAGTNDPYLVDYAGVMACKKVTFKVGTCMVDEWDPHMINAWMVQVNRSDLNAYASMTGGRPTWWFNNDAGWIAEKQSRALLTQAFWVMLPLWFTLHTELALPTVSLMYNDIILGVTLETAANLQAVPAGGTKSGTATATAQVLANYVFLDQIERRLFGRNINEYVGEAHQVMTPCQIQKNASVCSIPLHFNYPTVTLTVYVEKTSKTEEHFENYLAGYGPQKAESFDEMSLKIHGQTRIDKLPASYYRQVTHFRHGNHTYNPFRLYTMNFCARMGDCFQFNGGLHFGQVDTAHLLLHWNGDSESDNQGKAPEGYQAIVFGRHKNIFRTQLGVGGWRFGACL